MDGASLSLESPLGKPRVWSVVECKAHLVIAIKISSRVRGSTVISADGCFSRSVRGVGWKARAETTVRRDAVVSLDRASRPFNPSLGKPRVWSDVECKAQLVIAIRINSGVRGSTVISVGVGISIGISRS